MLRIVLMISFIYSSVWAQEAVEMANGDPEREAVFVQRAKKRQYPGGRDEEDLKVQSQVVNPPRKLAPQAEVREEVSDE